MTQTVGQKLKAIREEQNLTFEEVFEATRIRVAYLRALEDDDLSSMPSPVQARGYLRNYAEYLGLDIDQVLEELRLQQPSNEIIGPADFTSQPAISTPEPVDIQDEAPLSPPAVDPVQEAESHPEPTQELPESDITENLWQTWLNRISTVISTRANRKTDEQETTLVEEETETPDLEDEISQSDADTQQPEGNEPLPPSGEIFKEIGLQLRDRRETLSLHLNEVERNTHVKAHYLEALEDGAMDRLPSTVQTRGMLSNYASFLDMDVDAILLRFADALQARHREKNPLRPVRKTGQPIVPANLSSLSTFVAGDMIFGIGIAILLVGFAIWGINYVLTVQSEQEIQPTAPSISDILLASPDPSMFTATPTLLPVESFSDEATPTIVIPTINANVSVQVNLVAVERTYLRVIVDGDVAFEGRVIPGNAYLFEAEDQVEVLVGSGAAVRVAYNGRDLGLMGTFGQVVSNIYRAAEIITPTGLPSPTPTETVPPSPTLRPTNTPVPSRTAIP